MHRLAFSKNLLRQAAAVIEVKRAAKSLYNALCSTNPALYFASNRMLEIEPMPWGVAQGTRNKEKPYAT